MRRVDILSWNVTSLIPWLGDDQRLAPHIESLGAPPIVCLQEIRLRPADQPLIERMTTALPGYRCHYTLCNDPRNVTFRGGRAYGVATFVREDLGATLATAPSWDREGRVLVTAIPSLHLAVVNLYAVNGTPKPYFDPISGARAGDRHQYKQRFQRSVLALAAEMRGVSDVVLAGDWNVSPSALDVTPRLRTEEPHATARAQLADLFVRDGWVDILRAREPEARIFTWYGRTRGGRLDAARVDYFVVPREMTERIVDARVVSDADARPGSDHAPLLLTFEPRRA